MSGTNRNCGHGGSGGGAVRKTRATIPSNSMGGLRFKLVDATGKYIRGGYTYQQARDLARSMNTGKPPSRWVRMKVA